MNIEHDFKIGDHVEVIKGAEPSDFFDVGNRGLVNIIDSDGDLWVKWETGPGALSGDGVWCINHSKVRLVLPSQSSERRGLPNAVHQTTPTNCFRACVATVLGMAIDDVPTSCDGDAWDWDAFQEWLATWDLQAIEVGFGNGGTIYPVRRPVPCIISGPSPRECRTGLHAVVGEFLGLEGFRLLHDPHPSTLWIDGEPTHATFFVRL